MAESVIGFYKTQCVRRDGPIRTVEDLELVTASWAHWFNINRLHTSIGNMPPVEYEQHYHAAQPARGDPTRENPASTEPGALHSNCLHVTPHLAPRASTTS